MKAWMCKRWWSLHLQNPKECNNCGHRIFHPVSGDQLEEMTDGIETPEPVEVTQTVGTAKKWDPDGGPDVNPDGSINYNERRRETEIEEEHETVGMVSRILSWLR